MAKKHIVKQGEHLSGITSENDFRDFNTIWEDAQNAGLRVFRDPHVLFPGDKLTIPDRILKQLQANTGALHTFIINVRKLFLRILVLDLNSQPVKKADGKLSLESGDGDPVNTGDKGILIHDLGVQVKKGRLEVEKPAPKAGTSSEKLKFDLRIGHLNPETKLSGQQARLNNLGYFAGYSLNDVEQFLWAAEEFDCDHIKNSKKAVTARPNIVAVPVSDQQGGEETGDPARDTGITDEAICKKLKEVHGC